MARLSPATRDASAKKRRLQDCIAAAEAAWDKEKEASAAELETAVMDVVGSMLQMYALGHGVFPEKPVRVKVFQEPGKERDTVSTVIALSDANEPDDKKHTKLHASERSESHAAARRRIFNMFDAWCIPGKIKHDGRTFVVDVHALWAAMLAAKKKTEDGGKRRRLDT